MVLIKYIFKIIFNLSQLKLCARKAKVYLFRRPMRVQRRLFRQYGFVTSSHVVEIAFFDEFRSIWLAPVFILENALLQKNIELSQTPSVYKWRRIF